MPPLLKYFAAKRRWVFVIIAILGLIAAGLLINRPSQNSKEIKAYFANVHGLQQGAAVEIAGVQVGTVKSVKVNPASTSEPVEVVMLIHTDYPLNIPNDTVASIVPAGLIGGYQVKLSIKGTQGPPIKAGATLTTVETETINPIEDLAKILTGSVHRDESSTEGAKAKPLPHHDTTR